MSGIFEFRTTASNFDISFNYKIINPDTTFNTNTHYFSNDDIFYINDIEFTFTENGFITVGKKIQYKEIIITKDSNNNYLFNNKSVLPSFEYGVNYKIFTYDNIHLNSPIYITNNVF